jgi:hypothetical protein
MTILSFIEPTKFNWDVLRVGVELGDDATDEQVRLAEQEDSLEERKHLRKASRIAMIVGGGIVLCIVVLWPMPMYGSRYIFSKSCISLRDLTDKSSLDGLSLNLFGSGSRRCSSLCTHSGNQEPALFDCTSC